VTPIVEFIKEFLVPGSTWFFIAGVSLCTAMLYRSERTRRIARRSLAALAAFYWVISLPLTAHGLQVAERGRTPASTTALPDRPVPIVLLGNGLGGYAALGGRIETPLGQTALNTLYALDRYRTVPASVIIASGGPPLGVDGGRAEAAVMRDALVRNGVPADRILVEDASSTTREQAVATSKLLRARGETACIVVTSPQQMRRATSLFQQEGITALPLVAGSLVWSLGERSAWWHWLVPSATARAVSRDVFYELMAWPYYRMRGWVS